MLTWHFRMPSSPVLSMDGQPLRNKQTNINIYYNLHIYSLHIGMSPYERSSALCRARKVRNQFVPSCVCATIRTAILVNSSPDHHWNKHGADDVIVDHQCSISFSCTFISTCIYRTTYIESRAELEHLLNNVLALVAVHIMYSHIYIYYIYMNFDCT